VIVDEAMHRIERDLDLEVSRLETRGTAAQRTGSARRSSTSQLAVLAPAW
jgi:hypothetical protein